MFDALLFSLFFAVNFLRVNSYPWLSFESFGLALCLFLPTTVLFLTTEKIRQRWLFYALLFAVSADLSLGIVATLKEKGGLFLVVATPTLFLGTVFLLREKIRMFFRVWISVSLTVAVFLFFFMPIPLYAVHKGQSESYDNQALPNIYFLILDEHAGLNAWPHQPIYDALAKEIKDRYLKRGFLVYENASSNFCATLDSIPSILNAEIPTVPRSQINGKSLKTNRLFQKWVDQGYQIRVYQSTHLDYCGAQRVDKCFNYKENSAGFVADASLPSADKFWVLLNNFVEEHKSRVLIKIFRRFSPNKTSGEYMTGALAADRVFREMENDSALHPRGQVFFAHLLIPHSTYVLDEKGGVVSPFLWEAATGEPLNGSGLLNTPQSRARKFTFYAKQVRYLHRRLETFFRALDAQGNYRDSRFFLMSDHGSRIYLTAPVERFKSNVTPDDKEDAFSAFLVTRNPSVPPSALSDRVFTIRVAAEFFGLPADIPNSNNHYFQTSLKAALKDASG